MAVISIAGWEEKILGRLERAGAAGMSRTGLGIKSGAGNAGRAFERLVSERRIANIGSRARPRWVLSVYFKPLELACGAVEKNAAAAEEARGGAVVLVARKSLFKGLAGAAADKAEEALARLIAEGKLLRFKAGGRIYFAHRDRLPILLRLSGQPERPAPAPAAPGPTVAPIDREAVAAAYRRLRERSGYSHVEIAALQREAGCAMEALKEFIREESRQGRAVLGLGDWLLSSEESRAGAVELFGKPHLLVRLETE